MTPTVCLLPWGDPIEEYLDSIGVSLEAFRDEMTGGWLFGYVAALRSAGVDTVLVCWSRGVSRQHQWRHRPTGASMAVLPSAGHLRELRDIARVVRRTRADAILCQEYEYGRFERSVAVGRLLGVPVVGTFQGGLPPRGAVARARRRLAVRSSAGLIAAPELEARRVLRAYGRTAHRIANPVDPAAFGAAARERVRAELGIAEEEVVVAWHGRVEMHTKGLDVLADAWHELVRGDGASAPVRLLLVGTGPEGAALRARLGGVPGVRWIDEYVLDKARVAALLAAGDVFAFPSRHEGFAVAPLEAMATGLPVVAAAAPGIPDLLPRGRDSGGIVVPPGDAGALAAALRELIGDPAARAQLGRRARLRVEQAYAPAPVGRALRRVLLREERPA